MFLDQTQRLRLIGILLIVLLPHFLRVPVWVSLFAGAILLWQTIGTLRAWPQPGKYFRAALAMMAFAAVYLAFGRVDGQHAGVALLMLMMTLKLAETNAHRDVMMLLALSYFVLITHFLFSQEIVMALFLILACWLITAAFLDANHPSGALPARVMGRRAGLLMLHGLPVAILLFVLFPRIPGPIWGAPSAGANARTGLSDTMAPGMISNLAQSDEVAFRVRFDTPPPGPQQLYWRGPVFWQFNGRSWSEGWANRIQPGPPERRYSGEPARYSVTYEPHGQDWLLALDLAESIPDGAYMDAAGSLRVRKPQYERELLKLVSYPQHDVEAQQPNRSLLDYARRLPADGNNRSRDLAGDWRRAGIDDAAIVDRALTMFRQQPFRYTLQPRTTGVQNRIDRFLFDTREGFCEHYAEAFTFLMRAAGIPARVVTGYQGGEFNDLSDYMIVRASDAHAWSEVWLPRRGWVRIDPTSAVSPERIERGVSGALGADEPLPYLARRSGDLFYRLQMRWDLVNARWNGWFLSYGPELQRDFLAAMGLINLRATLLALTGLLALFLGLLGILLLWQARPRRNSDPAQRAWEQFCAKLAGIGLVRAPQEGPRDFGERVVQSRPELQSAVRRIVALYVALRYSNRTHDHRALAQAVRQFRPRSAARS
jgi:transglutaminase-like putative cysteine protease